MNKNNRYCFKISDFILGFDTKALCKDTSAFQPFVTEETAEYEISFHEVHLLPQMKGHLVYEEDIFAVFKITDFMYGRCFFESDIAKDTYAVGFYDYSCKQADIYYLTEYSCHFSEIANSFFHTGWESILLRENRLILHACCADTSYGGVLFSGPSGIGKSTQGDLWCRYENSRILNGDRPILYKDDDIWYAYGSPYAGSSKIHINDRTPVRAIVMLGQADDCSITRLGMADAFRSIYTMTTVSDWDEICTQNACDMIIDLIGKVPVYRMECTPDKNALKLLKSTIADGVRGG